ncbi:hypothetical protein PR048_011220 [Dryococelus australis]|uniref:Uncharacterized protein n=1 Tax=Dryococelus australis TaxID=614101 RepID=A0ABQ9HLJ2_9NEOP|nr:hypothetical protein PR048_011220 [Dryococelus australis]
MQKSKYGKDSRPIPRLIQMKYGEVLTSEEGKKTYQKGNSKMKKIKGLATGKGNPKRRKQGKENSSQPSSNSIDEENGNLEAYAENLLASEIPGVEYETPQMIVNINTGKFILADGVQNKIHYKYFNLLMKRIGIMVQELRVVGRNNTQFFLKENYVFTVMIFDIVAVLPNADISLKERKLIYIFPGKVDVKEQ